MRRTARTRLTAFATASFTALAVTTVAAGGTVTGVAAAAAAGPAHSSTWLPAPVPASAHAPRIYTHRVTKPPTTASCLEEFAVACYSPRQYQRAYRLNGLYDAGITGRGKTIAIVDSYGSPTIQRDVAAFDRAFHLPPARVSVIHPAGKPPAFDGKDDTMSGWAFETTLDVEYAHAIAPEAKILLVETPSAETEGSTGLPDMMYSEKYVIDHHLADVITQSFGATENTFTHPAKDIRSLRYAFTAAAKAHVTVLASSGDAGATDSTTGSSNYPYRVNSWPSSDPLVTSVGGTRLFLAASGARTKPDVVWNDGHGAGGGGKSQVFGRPAFQNAVKKVTGTRRGTPDISMSAAVKGSALVYLSYPGMDKGFYLVGGTSEASPLFAGIVALADQYAGHDLGDINPALYRLRGAKRAGIVDVTKGNNSFDGVKGFPAKRGYDLASGWGTVDASIFVKQLG